VIGAILIRTEMPRGVDGASASPREDDHRRWRARALGRVSSPCSQASHRDLWIYPVNGLGSLERLRRGLLGLRDDWGGGPGWSGHQTWMRRQINTKATSRSW
jgi:hypothetical protein